jgi:CubicO group peptidase (beta-lactamase class C family)
VDELVALAGQRMAAGSVPGLQIGLIDRDREWLRALGVADVRSGARTTDDTLFRIASITKTFTATSLVSLADAHRLDLDDPVRRYVPELTLSDEAAARRVTIRQLLLHTSGWVPGEQSGPDGPNALAEGSRLQGNGVQIAPPGELFSYNGVGYMVLGRVIEVVTGKPFEDVVRSTILAPLRMTRTKFNTESDKDVAADHTVRDGAADTLVDATSGRWGLASGGLRSTARDLLHYARCHFGESSVLSADAAARMAEPQVALPPPGESKALSWFVREVGEHRMLMHLGGAIGQQSLLAMVPRRRFALVVLTNSAAGSPVINAVLAHALERHLGAHEPALPKPITLAPDDLRTYEGRFRTLGNDVVLSVSADGLAMRLENTGAYAQRPTPPPATIAFWDRDRVVGIAGFAQGQYGDFLRDATGRVAYFRWGGRARRRVSH